jgi:acyl-CoA synthetase (AMP-forming)/AMP-acid ligase II
MIYRSPHPEISVPVSPLPEFVLERGRSLGSKPAIIDGATGRALTYAELVDGVERLASGLAARGLEKGEVVGLFSPNLPEYAMAFLGIIAAGGVVSTVNSLYTADEVAFQLHDARARFLITVPPFMDRASPAATKSRVEEVFVFGEHEGATPFVSLLAPVGPAPAVDVDPLDDLAVLPYSSGTTGLPKGVMLTHQNLVANLSQMRTVHHVQPDDVIIGVLPFFHIYGLVVIMNLALATGATIVTMPRFDLGPFLTLIQQYAITRAYLVPPIILALAKRPEVEGFDLSSLRVIMSGAAPLAADVAQACAERLGCNVIQGYGLTETSPVTHCTPDHDPAANKPGSIGPLLPNTEARVVDWGTEENLPPNADGEIWIRGPQVMRGYLSNPEATARTIDEDGWLHTGDIGHADEDGYFHIVDRLKELIKFKGYQVAPAVLEGVLLTHPAVADAAVIPTPDEEAGEVPKAYVVLRDEAVGPEDVGKDIMAYVAERVAPHEKVRHVEVIDQIPKSASGKILRRVLVERERAALRS